MEISTLANVLVGLFDLQAVVGLSLFAVVVYAVLHGLWSARHGSNMHGSNMHGSNMHGADMHPSDRKHR